MRPLDYACSCGCEATDGCDEPTHLDRPGTEGILPSMTPTDPRDTEPPLLRVPVPLRDAIDRALCAAFVAGQQDALPISPAVWTAAQSAAAMREAEMWECLSDYWTGRTTP